MKTLSADEEWTTSHVVHGEVRGLHRMKSIMILTCLPGNVAIMVGPVLAAPK